MQVDPFPDNFNLSQDVGIEFLFPEEAVLELEGGGLAREGVLAVVTGIGVGVSEVQFS